MSTPAPDRDPPAGIRRFRGSARINAGMSSQGMPPRRKLRAPDLSRPCDSSLRAAATVGDGHLADPIGQQMAGIRVTDHRIDNDPLIEVSCDGHRRAVKERLGIGRRRATVAAARNAVRLRSDKAGVAPSNGCRRRRLECRHYPLPLVSHAATFESCHDPILVSARTRSAAIHRGTFSSDALTRRHAAAAFAVGRDVSSIAATCIRPIALVVRSISIVRVC